MDLYSFLKEKDKLFPFIYYPTYDLAFNNNLEKIYNMQENIENYFNNYNFSTVNNSQFIDYIICRELQKYNSDKKYLNNKSLFEKKFSSLNLSYKKLSKINWLDFLKNNIIDINSFDIRLLNLYYNFLNFNIKIIDTNTIKISITKLYNFYIKDINFWYEYFFTTKLYEELLNNFDQLIKFNLENTLLLIYKLKKDNININKYIDKLNVIMNNCLIKNIDNAIRSQINFNKILSFYKKMNIPDANKYLKLKTKVDENVSEWLSKNGQSYKINLPINEMVEYINKIDKLGLKIISITHQISLDDKKKKFVSLYENAFYTEKNCDIPFLQITSSNQPESKTYNFFTKKCFYINETGCITLLLNFLETEEKYNNYTQVIKSFVDYIINKIGCNDNEFYEETLSNLFDSLYQISIEKITDNKKNKEVVKYVIDFIEKYLRDLYYFIEKDNMFVNDESLTIGIMVDKNRSSLKKIFSDEFLDGLRYYLSSETNSLGEKVGLDWRNKTSHSGNMLLSDYNYTFSIRVLFVFTTLVNEGYLCFNQNPNIN